LDFTLRPSLFATISLLANVGATLVVALHTYAPVPVEM